MSKSLAPGDCARRQVGFSRDGRLSMAGRLGPPAGIRGWPASRACFLPAQFQGRGRRLASSVTRLRRGLHGRRVVHAVPDAEGLSHVYASTVSGKKPTVVATASMQAGRLLRKPQMFRRPKGRLLHARRWALAVRPTSPSSYAGADVHDPGDGRHGRHGDRAC